jgi:Xaa-Pro aminopeptidase
VSAIPPAFVPFDDAQRRARRLLHAVMARVQPGMTADQVAEECRALADHAGVTGWYHVPEVRVGTSIRGGLRGLLSRSRRSFEVGDLVAVDLAPAWGDAWGDIGATRVVGDAPEPAVVAIARTATEGCCGIASRWKTVGELHVFARAWAVNHRMDLAEGDAIGHRVLSRDDLPRVLSGSDAGRVARIAHAATRLRSQRIHRLNPVRMSGMFAVRPVVVDAQGLAAAFEEIVWVDGDGRGVLGLEAPSA